MIHFITSEFYNIIINPFLLIINSFNISIDFCPFKIESHESYQLYTLSSKNKRWTNRHNSSENLIKTQFSNEII